MRRTADPLVLLAALVDAANVKRVHVPCRGASVD